MDNTQVDMNRELMLDGNAVAGILYNLFEREMTTVPAQCANCGNTAELGALLAFTQSPGIVLRCPDCEAMVMRFVMTDDYVLLDARGAAYLRIQRRT